MKYERNKKNITDFFRLIPPDNAQKKLIDRGLSLMSQEMMQSLSDELYDFPQKLMDAEVAAQKIINFTQSNTSKTKYSKNDVIKSVKAWISSNSRNVTRKWQRDLLTNPIYVIKKIGKNVADPIHLVSVINQKEDVTFNKNKQKLLQRRISEFHANRAIGTVEIMYSLNGDKKNEIHEYYCPKQHYYKIIQGTINKRISIKLYKRYESSEFLAKIDHTQTNRYFNKKDHEVIGIIKPK